jgi:hypothetical protein
MSNRRTRPNPCRSIPKTDQAPTPQGRLRVSALPARQSTPSPLSATFHIQPPLGTNLTPFRRASLDPKTSPPLPYPRTPRQTTDHASPNPTTDQVETTLQTHLLFSMRTRRRANSPLLHADYPCHRARQSTNLPKPHLGTFAIRPAPQTDQSGPTPWTDQSGSNLETFLAKHSPRTPPRAKRLTRLEQLLKHAPPDLILRRTHSNPFKPSPGTDRASPNSETSPLPGRTTSLFLLRPTLSWDVPPRAVFGDGPR